MSALWKTNDTKGDLVQNYVCCHTLPCALCEGLWSGLDTPHPSLHHKTAKHHQERISYFVTEVHYLVPFLSCQTGFPPLKFQRHDVVKITCLDCINRQLGPNVKQKTRVFLFSFFFFFPLLVYNLRTHRQTHTHIYIPALSSQKDDLTAEIVFMSKKYS